MRFKPFIASAISCSLQIDFCITENELNLDTGGMDQSPPQISSR